MHTRKVPGSHADYGSLRQQRSMDFNCRGGLCCSCALMLPVVQVKPTPVSTLEAAAAGTAAPDPAAADTGDVDATAGSAAVASAPPAAGAGTAQRAIAGERCTMWLYLHTIAAVCPCMCWHIRQHLLCMHPKATVLDGDWTLSSSIIPSQQSLQVVTRLACESLHM